MGCDIHAHVEVLVAGKWEHWAAPSIDRNYRLFTWLAGVRSNGEEKQLYPVRGVPDDVSSLTKIDQARCGRDGHTFSWITSKEMDELARMYLTENGWAEPLFGYLFDNSFSDREAYPESIEDCRMVFWFDN